MPSLMQFAVAYWQAGWSIFPVNPKTKAPLCPWREYAIHQCEPEDIKTWWGRWPQASIGVACGKLSGITVIDIDHGNEDTMLIAGKLPLTVRSFTGGGGVHLFCKYEPIKNSVKRVHPQVDMKGEGGYVILPPSHHASGKDYAWDPLFPFSQVNLEGLAAVPEYLVKASEEGDENLDWQQIVRGVVKGSRNISAAQVTGKLLNAFKDDYGAAWTMLQAWNTKNVPPLPEHELEGVFVSIFKRHHKSTIDLTELRKEIC